MPWRWPPPTGCALAARPIGADGHALLEALYASVVPPWLRAIPVVETSRRVWVRQFRLEEGAVHWRATDASPHSSVCIGSPHDEDAHDARNYTTSWAG